MYVLDTDKLSLLFAGHPRVLRRQTAVPSSEIAITIVNAHRDTAGTLRLPSEGRLRRGVTAGPGLAG